MKTFRMIGAAVVVAVFAFAFSACEKDGKEDYKDYPQLIVGKWFNFSPTASVYLEYKDDATFGVVGYDQKVGWVQFNGTYGFQGNNLTQDRTDGNVRVGQVELTDDQFIFRDDPVYGEIVHYRVKEQFDIKGGKALCA